jgi:hypothetical protein
MLCAFLGTLYPFLGMLHAFLGMPCEGEDAIHEESRGLHALHGVRGPFRRRGNECVGSSWERETTRYAYVGMPREHRPEPCAFRWGGCNGTSTEDVSRWWVERDSNPRPTD